MAIYHLEAKAVSRGSGRSAVAAAAYMSCSEIHNEYDGVTHDFTRKRGLVWEQVILPQNAPPEWNSRSNLWNAVEAAEKSKDSRLARELVVALPIELDKTQWIKLLTEYIRESFIADGMCADVAIHDTDGHNPHAHILLTVRPLDKKGYVARTIEQKGFVADRCAINRQIKADNALLRELKATMRKISQSVKNTLPAIAEAMETLREKMIVLRYHIQTGSAVARKSKRTIQSEKATLVKYAAVAEQITTKKKERKELQNKKKSTPALRIAIQHDLSRQIAELTEELEELKSEKQRLLRELKCADDSGIQKVQSEIARIESALATLDETEKKNIYKLNKVIQRYKDLKKQSAAFDKGEFAAARLKIRPEKQLSAENKLQSSYGKNFSIRSFFSAIRETDRTLNDTIDVSAAKEFENRQHEQPRRKTSGRIK